MLVTKLELVDILKESTATEIEIVLDSPVRMNKRNNPLANADVVKHIMGRYRFGSSYEKSVNHALEAADVNSIFFAKGLPWGKWVPGAVNRVIEYKDEYYVRYYNPLDDVYFSYTVNGRAATARQQAIIEQFLPSKNGSRRQWEAGLSQQEQISVQSAAFSHIVSLTIDGITYELCDEYNALKCNKYS